MIATLVLACAQAAEAGDGLQRYSAWLVSPGGQIAFGLELSRAAPWRAFLVNGEERIEVPRVELEGDRLLLEMAHYDSRIRATISQPSRGALTGTWEKRRGAERSASLEFHARSLPLSASWTAPTVGSGEVPFDVTGRWAVDFEEDDSPAVAVLQQRGSELEGTFLTGTGDYRYLSGGARSVPVECWKPMGGAGNSITLSCFDGAHAFLFEARVHGDDLSGDFWSGDWHHETWSAKRDASAQLADPFAQTKWNGTTRLADLAFPDLDGATRNLGELGGKATLLVVFGSWCPNCNDEAQLLAELDAKYRERGLRILGLAFELTGERERDAEQVRIFARRHALEIPMLLCGTADKDEATKALGLVDRVRAFPTTVFVGADGLPRAVHSGFAGPATGEEHARLRAEFERRIEELLAGR